VATPIVKVLESWYNIHVKIGIAGEVVEFIFKRSEDEFFTDEGHPGLMVGRDWKSHEVIGYMTYDLPALYERILEGLQQNPISGRFAIVAVSEAGHPVSITDKGMTDLEFAEVVKWTYRAYSLPMRQCLRRQRSALRHR
jgi:hypothetical protein